MSREIIDRRSVIESLEECDELKAEKAQLEEEVVSLHPTKDLDEVKTRVASLEKDLNEVKTSEILALERANKAAEVSDTLRKEIDAEKTSSAPVVAEVNLLKSSLKRRKLCVWPRPRHMRPFLLALAG